MANELQISLDPFNATGLTLLGKVYASTGLQLGADVAMTEDSTGVYTGDYALGAVADGAYMVRFQTATKMYGTGELYVRGGVEVTQQNFFNPATDTVANVTLVDTTTTNTDMRGTDGANTTAPDNASVASILADTNELQTNQGNWNTATGFSTPTNVTDAQASIIAEVNANEGKIDALETKASRLDALIEDSTGDRFTAKALETAPTAEMSESELHTALDSYTNKDDWKSSSVDLSSVLTAIGNLNDVSTADLDAALATYDAPTLTEMTAAFTELKGATWTTANTLEAITTAIGSGGTTPAEIWAYATRGLTQQVDVDSAAIASAILNTTAP